jgi:polyphosphate kinase 2
MSPNSAMNPSARFFSLPTYVWLRGCLVAVGCGESVTCPNAGTLPSSTDSMSLFSRELCSEEFWRRKCTDDPDSVGLNRGADPRSQKTTMGKNSKNNKKPKSTLESNTQPCAINGQPKVGKKIGKNEYEAGIFKLQVELVKLQDWVKENNARIVIIFEGRDAAGKGGMIKRIMERVSPRIFRVVALPAPTERQKTQLPAQRYIEQLPAGGEVVIFDRSWYNRAGVEYVMGFCTDEEHREFLRDCPIFEGFLISQGIILLKYWLEVSEKEQHKRFLARIEDPSKRWKLSPMDLESHRRWYDYSRARDAMLAATDTVASPWHIVLSDDKKRARLNCIAHILSSIPYEEIPYSPPKLPPRQKPKGYVEPKQKHRSVPQVW